MTQSEQAELRQLAVELIRAHYAKDEDQISLLVAAIASKYEKIGRKDLADDIRAIGRSK